MIFKATLKEELELAQTRGVWRDLLNSSMALGTGSLWSGERELRLGEVRRREERGMEGGRGRGQIWDPPPLRAAVRGLDLF